jgi:NAD(P)-dependent dehydrogenase (short-subunit alcohol dehydrogenase family)
MKLQGRSVVITGSGSGIGRSCATEFAKAGAFVVVSDIDLEGAEKTAQQIKAAGGKSVAFHSDVSSPSSVEALVEKTLQQYSKIDVLINNAAMQVNKTVADTTFEEWNKQMSVNVGGVFLCSKLFLSKSRSDQVLAVKDILSEI